MGMTGDSTPPSSASGEARLELLVQSFLDRYRQGENVSIHEYIQKNPDLGDRIQELFPGLLLMERLKIGDAAGAESRTEVAGETHHPQIEKLAGYTLLREV